MRSGFRMLPIPDGAWTSELAMSAQPWVPESTSKLTTPSRLPPTSGFNERRLSVHKPMLVVTTRLLDEIEARIDQDYDARRSHRQRPFTRDELIEASSGADALFITPFDRLD